jgi:hypothetical protein
MCLGILQYATFSTALHLYLEFKSCMRCILARKVRKAQQFVVIISAHFGQTRHDDDKRNQIMLRFSDRYKSNEEENWKCRGRGAGLTVRIPSSKQSVLLNICLL